MVVPLTGRIGPPALLVLLADGQVHSGQSLAGNLGVSRAAVWKGVQRLRMQGIDIASLARRGYALAEPVELLNGERIRGELAAAQRHVLRTLELPFEIDSTNTRLLSIAAPPFGCADACLTELQTGGRGRRGRAWLAPFGGGLALSLSWSFPETGRDLPALSLAVGVAVARALARVGAAQLALKWPNDIWYRDRKIGGVLLELRAEAGGPAHVVIGIGINVALTAQQRRGIEAGGARVAALADACATPPSRNRVAGAILDEVLAMLAEFQRAGFAPFKPAWESLDALRGRQTRVLLGERSVAGRARGVDENGVLLLDTDGGLLKFSSGEASLRLEDDGT